MVSIDCELAMRIEIETNHDGVTDHGDHMAEIMAWMSHHDEIPGNMDYYRSRLTDECCQ